MTDEGRMPAQPSMKVAMKQHVELPTDLGLLAGSLPSPSQFNHYHHAHLLT